MNINTVNVLVLKQYVDFLYIVLTALYVGMNHIFLILLEFKISKNSNSHNIFFLMEKK